MISPLCSSKAVALFALSLMTAGFSRAAESTQWPQWRGPQGNGSTSGVSPAAAWDVSQVQWKVALPGKGCSTPIVWKNQIYLTAPVGGKDALLALDSSGKQLWQTVLGEAESPGRHRNGSGSNPSPVTDGKGIFVSFKSGQFAALNMDGSIRWRTDLVEKYGPVKLNWDYGTSPALTEKNVIMARMHNGDSWVAAFDKETGEQRWKTARNYETPREVDNSYTTPVLIRHEGKEAVLVWGAQHLTVHDAEEGKLLWSCGAFNPENTANWPAVATPVIVDDIAVVCFGRADRGLPRLHGIKLGGSGDVTATHRAWVREDTGAFVPSPAEYKGRVYVLTDRGQVDCLESATGKTVWSEALPRSSSNYYSSPLIAGGIMYAAREDGAVFVVSVENGFKLVAEHKFDDHVIASIVAGADRLFIRGEANLYCVAAK